MSSNNELSRRLKFLKVTAETSSSLLELKPLLAKRLPIALEKFYKHLNEFPEVSELQNLKLKIKIK